MNLFGYKLDKTTSPIEFLNSYCTFDNPREIWILKGISRNKDNSNPDSERFMRRLILTSLSDIESCYEDIRKMGNKLGTTYRMYVSLNSRDSVKGFFNFQKNLLDISYDVSRNLSDAIELTKKINSKWKTELEQKRNRGTKRLLLDIDESDVNRVAEILSYIGKMEEEGKTKLYTFKRTVSGYAVVIDACDVRQFEKKFKDYQVDIQRDSMLFVDCWDGTN